MRVVKHGVTFLLSGHQIYDSCLRKEKSGTRGQKSNKDTEELQRAHGDKPEDEDEDEDEDRDGDGDEDGNGDEDEDRDRDRDRDGASDWVRVAARFAVAVPTPKELIASEVPVGNCCSGTACATLLTSDG